MQDTRNLPSENFPFFGGGAGAGAPDPAGVCTPPTPPAAPLLPELSPRPSPAADACNPPGPALAPPNPAA